MTPLEQAARALAKLEDPSNEGTDWLEHNWDSYLEEVRAVLMAIREPSEAMLNSAAHGAINPLWLATSYTKMIDALLEEGL